MNKDKIKMLANIVREHREAKGYTQKEVSEISNISLRSIQRIENGEVKPRMYTVKTLAECLNFSLDFLHETTPLTHKATHKGKVIISISSGLITILLAAAFIAQSSTFPETTFEKLLFWVFVAITISIIQYRLWTSRS